ncbi:response regulator, partial [Candidatus Sumerlaeota bacterium]|nr:response regulator [Candidatus Sumerlaeota bacterium]
EGYGAGADLYLTKPFDPSRLAKTIEGFMAEHRTVPRPKRCTAAELAKMVSAPAKPEPTCSVEVEQAVEPSAPVSQAAAAESPAREAVAPTVEAPVPPPAPQAAQPLPRVMIVDDDPEVLAIVALTLSRGFETVTAHNGVEAVEKIIVYQPDIVVLDALMPKMSGYQLCASLRRNPSYCDTPIIFVSAKASPRDQEYCRRLGATDFVAKPFNPHVLRQRIVGLTMQPGFAVRPKKLTLTAIQALERGQVKWADEPWRAVRDDHVH